MRIFHSWTCSRVSRVTRILFRDFCTKSAHIHRKTREWRHFSEHFSFSPTSSIFLPSFHLTYHQSDEYEQWKCEKRDSQHRATTTKPQRIFALIENLWWETTTHIALIHFLYHHDEHLVVCEICRSLHISQIFFLLLCAQRRWSGGKFAKQQTFSRCFVVVFQLFQVNICIFRGEARRRSVAHFTITSRMDCIIKMSWEWDEKLGRIWWSMWT